ncbi:MAG: hypothetical protein ACI4ND_01650 [Succinivibrio sp.]
MLRKTVTLIAALLAFTAAADELIVKDKLFITTLNDIYTNLEELYKNTTVTFSGELDFGRFDSPGLENEEFAFVYRLGPGCCYNDGYAGMYLEYDGELPEKGSWLEVSGIPFYFEHDGFTELFLRVSKLKVLDKKGSLYVKD